jgi:hypothetical protein
MQRLPIHGVKGHRESRCCGMQKLHTYGGIEHRIRDGKLPLAVANAVRRRE